VCSSDLVDRGILGLDAGERITQINTRALELLEVTPEEALGRKIGEFLPRPVVAPVVDQGLKVRSAEVLTSTPKRFHFFLSANPVRVGGEIAGAVISIEDIKDLRSVVNKLSQNQFHCSFEDIFGESEALQETKRYARQIALGDSAVLIQGETGTGKELFARAIHSHSKRSEQPFIPVNCAAIPEALLESELFGYEEGAFSGARKGGKPGKFELAKGGTLFLDEIGDMPLHMQVKLLRALQEKTIERVGGRLSLNVDVRVIASTHQNLEEMVANKAFRADLFFRLNVMPISIPPLRNRRPDIAILARHFISKYAQKFGRRVYEASREGLRLLEAYHWPGNVRELENAMEYAVNLTEGAVITPRDLPAPVSSPAPRMKGRGGDTLRDQLRHREKEIIDAVLEMNGRSVAGKQAAARQLGISLPTLYRRINDLKA
jgi:transcriptional regulator with PAS, ATPase and Fis domain